MKIVLFSLLAIFALSADPKAVIFDWGNVLATSDREVVVHFMCDTLHCSKEEFEKANREKREAIKSGKTDVEFWLQYANLKGIKISSDWPQTYNAVLKASVGVDPKMERLVSRLKEKQNSVGILSNIDDRYTKLIRDFGFYKPYKPCLLSCEIELEKPDPKVYELLLQTLNIPAKDVVFIDDKRENVEAAKKMGIDAIVFQSAEQIENELKKRDLL